jgi:hypothetical protein
MAQLSRGVLMFQDDLNPQTSPGNITWGAFSDGSVLQLDSGRQTPTDTNASVFIGSNENEELSYVDVSAGRFRVNGVDQGRGIVSNVSLPTTTSPLTAETIAMDTGTLAFYPGRAYKITLHAIATSATAGDVPAFRIRVGTVAGNSIMDSLRTCKVEVANTHVVWEASQYVKTSSVTPGSPTVFTNILATYYRAAGTGNVSMFSNAFNQSWMTIEDVGIVDNYPGAKNL